MTYYRFIFSVPVLLVLLVGLFYIEMPTAEKIKCYDRHNNIILGQECIDKDYHRSPLFIYSGYVFVGCILFFLFYLMGYFMDMPKWGEVIK